jgi:hypothetical protein
MMHRALLYIVRGSSGTCFTVVSLAWVTGTMLVDEGVGRRHMSGSGSITRSQVASLVLFSRTMLLDEGMGKRHRSANRLVTDSALR